MFNSIKSNDSHYLNNATLPNENCNGVPKMTSTPLNSRHLPLSRRSSVLLSPTKSKLVTPRRYSLSEINSPMNKSNDSIQTAHSPGPLLASLNYRDNVSMYEETKSSGLARRIVLYNEEAEKERRPTHQEKYHSPGLFPIVHLFKKKPPLLEQSPKRVKIKLSSPDYLKSYSPQHKNKLLEGLARPKLSNQHNLSSCSKSSIDTGTKSVLDALKEISRKRIHSNEEYDLNEDSGKRIRTELYNGGTTTGKRIRADSPQSETSESPPLKQSQKKFCVYDEFAASKSSTDFSFLHKLEPLRSKRKTISTSTESLKETKHVKLINAETQTILSKNANDTTKVGSITDESDSHNGKKKESLKVFDDAPLDRIRKNRLAALMGNLAGKDAAILPKSSTTEDNFTIENKKSEEKSKSIDTTIESEQVLTTPTTSSVFGSNNLKFISKPTSVTENGNKSEIDLTNKPLTSILSPPRTTKELSPVKSDKHVHFSLPEVKFPVPSNQTSSTKTFTSTVTSIVASSSTPVSKSTEEFSFPVTPSVNVNTKPVTTPSSTISFSFGNPGVSKSDTLLSRAADKTTNNASSLFNFSTSLQTSKQDTSSTPNLTFSAPKPSSPQKSGGFKFELKTPTEVSTVAKVETPTLTFSNSSLASSTIGTVSTTSLSSSNSATFTFGKPAEAKTDSSFSFETTTKSSAVLKPTFTFGGEPTKSENFNSTSTELKFPSLTTTGISFESAENKQKFGNFVSIGQSTAPPTFGNTAITTTASFNTSLPASGFASTTFVTPSTTISAFGNTKNVTTTTTASGIFTFGGTSTASSSGFGSKPTLTFGTSTTAVSGFGNILTTTSSVFGSSLNTATPAFGTPVSSTPVFGTPVTSTPVFGTVTSSAAFGSVPSTSTSTFASSSAPTSVFGSNPVTSTSVFGSTNTSIVGGFKTTTPTSSVFGSSTSTFGSNPATVPVFGAGASDTKANNFGSSSGFGSVTQAPTFGSNSSTSFGNSLNPKPIFGSSSTPTPNTSSPFGSNTFGNSSAVAVTTTSASVFSASNPTSTFSFGSNKPTTNVFGAASTTNSSTFGNNSFSSTSAFSPSAGFGNNTPAFGGSTTPSNNFGAPSAPTFGVAENKPAFAFGGSSDSKPNSGFGSGPGNSAFAKPTNTQLGFGSSSGGFGPASSSSINSQQTNGGFNFGSNAASPSPAPFAFGANSGISEPPKPTFNFTGGTANPPAFGASSSTPVFGSSNSSFGVPAAPSFGATGSSAAGVFNIGAGSNTGRPRTQLRAKRRT